MIVFLRTFWIMLPCAENKIHIQIIILSIKSYTSNIGTLKFCDWEPLMRDKVGFKTAKGNLLWFRVGALLSAELRVTPICNPPCRSFIHGILFLSLSKILTDVAFDSSICWRYKEYISSIYKRDTFRIARKLIHIFESKDFTIK